MGCTSAKEAPEPTSAAEAKKVEDDLGGISSNLSKLREEQKQMKQRGDVEKPPNYDIGDVGAEEEAEARELERLKAEHEKREREALARERALSKASKHRRQKSDNRIAVGGVVLDMGSKKKKRQMEKQVFHREMQEEAFRKKKEAHERKIARERKKRQQEYERAVAAVEERKAARLAKKKQKVDRSAEREARERERAAEQRRMAAEAEARAEREAEERFRAEQLDGAGGKENVGVSKGGLVSGNGPPAAVDGHEADTLSNDLALHAANVLKISRGDITAVKRIMKNAPVPVKRVIAAIAVMFGCKKEREEGHVSRMSYIGPAQRLFAQANFTTSLHRKVQTDVDMKKKRARISEANMVGVLPHYDIDLAKLKAIIQKLTVRSVIASSETIGILYKWILASYRYHSVYAKSRRGIRQRAHSVGSGDSLFNQR